MRLLCCCFFSFFPSRAQVDSDTSGSALDLIPPFITRSWVTDHLAASPRSSSCTKDSLTNSEVWLFVRPQLCLKDPLKRAEDFSFFARFSLYSIPHIHTSLQSQCVMWQQQRNLQLQTRARWTPKLFAAFIQFFPPQMKQAVTNKGKKMKVVDLWSDSMSANSELSEDQAGFNCTFDC